MRSSTPDRETARPRQSCLFYALAGALALLGGCSQGEGERCEINSDCASGLICTGLPHNGVCKPNTTGISTGGTTGTPEVPVTDFDAGAEIDTASPEIEGGTALTD